MFINKRYDWVVVVLRLIDMLMFLKPMVLNCLPALVVLWSFADCWPWLGGFPARARQTSSPKA